MRSFLLAALTGMVAANVAPLQTPAPNVSPEMLRRQEVSQITSAVALASSLVTRTFAYYSGGDTEGLVLWAPITYESELFSFTSSGDYWRGCSSTFYATIGTSVSANTDCPMFTTCSDGWLVAASTSYYCVAETLSCYTELLYSTYGASDALSWLYCGTSSANATNTAYYRTKPPADVAASTSDAAVTPAFRSTSTSASPGPSTTITPEPTTSAPAAGGKKSSNAGPTAGGVVGGVAILALAGVAIFWILRKKSAAAATTPNAALAVPTSGTAGPYHSDAKPPANVQVGEYAQHGQPMMQGGYDPHQSGVYSMGSTSPTMGPAVVPPYSPGPHQSGYQHRNELPS